MTGTEPNKRKVGAPCGAMSMFWAILLTFVITVLGMLVLFQRDGTIKREAENKRLLKENDSLKRQISDYYSQDHSRRERTAYNQGLYDGRKTDQLYRSMLKRYSSGEQISVMLNGEDQHGRHEYE